MRLVVDALSVGEGGLATYVQGIVGAWCEVAPQDHIKVLVTGTFGQDLAADPRFAHHRIVVHRARRPAGAWRLARAEAIAFSFQAGADALLATVPLVPRFWRKPCVALVCDLRHEDRPADFGVARRLARRLTYGNACRRADRVLAISERTAASLRNRYPRSASSVRVVSLGADHVGAQLSSRTGPAIAFGNSSHKEPILLLQAWKELLCSRLAPAVPTLHIVALTDPDRHLLSERAVGLGIADRVELRPRLPSRAYRETMQSASVLLMPSRYEGFGLPVLEAMRRGIPVVISPDAALVEVSAGHAVVADGWAPQQLATATRLALAMTSDRVAAARIHANRFRWCETVRLTRASIAEAIRSR